MSVAPNTEIVRPEWAASPIRLDPRLADTRQTIELLDGDEVVSYKVDRRGAVVKRKLERSGLPVSIALPANSFLGVAARAMEHDDGTVTVTLELHHSDATCTVPLLVASDLYDVAADWRGWADLFGLPMLMVEADGRVQSLEETLGDIKTAEPAPRRYSPSKGRRPRFLARRRPGGMGCRMQVSGIDVIDGA